MRSTMCSMTVWTTGVARGLALVLAMPWAGCGDEPDAPAETGSNSTGSDTNGAATETDGGPAGLTDTGNTASAGDDGNGDSDGSGGLDETDTASQSETDGGDTTGVACSVLYGRPNEKTGLTAEQCQPSCNCGGRDFTDTEYTAADAAALRARTLETVLDAPSDDPYATPEKFPEPSAGVCAVLPGEQSATGYRLQSFADADAALKAGGQVTHAGPCGLCSTLADLAVYMETPDLTEPVRACGLKGLNGGQQAVYDCIRALGFTDACTQIWAWNTKHTQSECLSVCLTELNNPYHRPDGSLNPCLQCDEDKSGAVFKNVAGRTRRNTGIANALCRPCESVTPLVHRY